MESLSVAVRLGVKGGRIRQGDDVLEGTDNGRTDAADRTARGGCGHCYNVWVAKQRFYMIRAQGTHAWCLGDMYVGSTYH